MTNRENLARQWAETARHEGDDLTRAAVEHIMATTTPPTMADVEWDDETHHLAGATTAKGSEVVMIWRDIYDALIITDQGEHSSDWLTPNGKRYELREKPDHPEVLTTVEDYQNAPYGTIVAGTEPAAVFVKSIGSWHAAGHTALVECVDLEGTRCTVVRWGGEA